MAKKNTNQFTIFSFLRTFYNGETIRFKTSGEFRKSVFVRYNNSHLIILDENGEEESIELHKITSITL